MWIAAVRRENWTPCKYTWLCSSHFISGKKSNDPVSQDYVSLISAHTKTLVREKLENDLERYDRQKECKRQRLQNSERMTAAN